MRALEAALNSVWAMEEGALETLLTIAAREHEVTPEALEAYRAKSVANTERATERNGVAIISAQGAMFKRANLFTEMSGATSYAQLMRDFQASVDNPALHAILFNLDTPGGEASGVAEFAQAVYDARGVKPIYAYVGGSAASAGYWIASAVEPGNIIIDPTALLGSIGVQMGMRQAADRPGEKSFRFVSSQSPLKNADPGTDEGAAQIQQMVDAMAKVFVETVARNRGVGAETVLSDFGQGGIFVGQQAIDAGLADRIGSFESVIAELSAARSPALGGRQSVRIGASMDNPTGATAATTPETTTANDTATAPAAGAPAVAGAPGADVVADAVAAALAGERTRTAQIRRYGAAFGVADATVNAAIESGSSVAEFTAKIVEAEEAKKAGRVAALAADETALTAPAASTGTETGELTADDVAAQINASANAAAGTK